VSLTKSRHFQAIFVSGGSLLGSLGHILILVWMMAMVLLVPTGRLALSAGFCLLLTLGMCPSSFERLVKTRTLILLAMILITSLVFGSSGTETHPGSLPFTYTALASGLQMVLRAVVLLVAISAFSSSVEISEVAGVAERLGLRGLGFSIGVAFNLLPSLSQAANNTWNSLHMRGGFRAHKLQSLRLLLLTILGNALRRGDEIALAAEARAFSPEQSRAMPLRRGKLDLWLVLPLLGILLAFIFVP
jgi:energy-coupling factor transporter transmembrane protein EcfT